MRKLACSLCAAMFLLCGSFLHATIFGKIQGVVHDPQHRPIAAASVVLKSSTSAWSQTTQTDQEGGFSFSAVPIGDYVVTVSQSGFESSEQTVTVTSGTAPVLHFQLKVASVNQTTVVSAQAETARRTVTERYPANQ